ncbi:hypothetical protein LAZ67_15000806 [Cordylochernes scorpioides]|uniref:Retroviral polymerase SH3-like domain-containing protein n=1 Tax=Cordylochernes scorpioides TaxID=51811 RepID=A0ABY6L8B8_9ARAC|nr:hypothetical protein LAZ67_15000806 [Cordylochernes scorpioides]
MLTVAYGEATLDRSNVYRWYNMFSEGREDVNDEEQYALHASTREEHPTTQDVWIIDSACTSHMTSHGDWIEHKTEERRSIQVAEERRHIESASSGLIQATVQEAVNTAAYLYNLTPTTNDPDTTPMEKWKGKKPSVSHIMRFGCEVFYKLENHQRHKLEAKSKRGIFVGYSRCRRAYRVFDITARVILETADIHFRENNNVISEEKQSDNNTDTDTYFFIQEDEQLDNHVLSDVDIEEPAPDTMINRQTESSESDRPQRTRTIPKRFDDYVLATTNETIPKDYEEAIACEDKKHWDNAMLEEIQNMYSHQVWELVPRPVNAKHTYQEALGMLMFLAVNTRPDIAYITSKLSQYSRQPKQMHLTAIKRVMRYLRGTIDLGVKFERGKTGILKSYADASWSTTHDGKSYGGYVLKLGEATIDWKSSKQPLVALSTMEAEMIAACESCCQIKWIINLLRELEEWNFMEKPTAIYTDSQSLINWTSSPKQSSRCRHINRKYHFLRDCYESRDICLLYKPSQDLEADIFTKDLSRDQMKKHLESLSIVGIKPNLAYGEAMRPYVALVRSEKLVFARSSRLYYVRPNGERS